VSTGAARGGRGFGAIHVLGFPRRQVRQAPEGCASAERPQTRHVSPAESLALTGRSCSK
jgi:hypothetical protein